MVFAEIIIRKTERNRNQNKQNEQGKTTTQKTCKTEGKKKKKEQEQEKESLDGSVSLQIIKKLDQIKYKQTNKQLQEQEVQRVTWFSVKSIPAKKMICPAPMQDVRLTRM